MTYQQFGLASRRSLQGLVSPLPAVLVLVALLRSLTRTTGNDEGYGVFMPREKGLPAWVFALLVIVLVAAVLVLALIFLVPPSPPPYT